LGEKDHEKIHLKSTILIIKSCFLLYIKYLTKIYRYDIIILGSKQRVFVVKNIVVVPKGTRRSKMQILGLVLIVIGILFLLTGGAMFSSEDHSKDAMGCGLTILAIGIFFLWLGAINKGYPDAWGLEKSVIYENMTQNRPTMVRDWMGTGKFVILVKKVATDQAELHYIDQMPIESKFFTINEEGEMVTVNIKDKDDEKLPTAS
jgi:hypothetical protein